MNKPADWVWLELRNAFRGRLKTNQLAIFAGRLAAWHLMPNAAQPSVALTAPAPGEDTSARQLRDAWKQLANDKQLGDLRYAFEDTAPFPYEHLSDTIVSKANQLLGSVILFERADRLALANHIVEALLEPSAPGDIDFPLEVAAFVIRLIDPKDDELVFCPGPNADSLAIATMQQAGHPVIVSDQAPIAACLFAAISRAELTVIFQNPYRPTSVRSAASDGYSLGAILPPFGRKLGNVDKLGWIPSQFGVRTSEALGVELALRLVKVRSVVVVPNGFLFSSGPDKALREHLTKEGGLAAVISFPGGLLAGTNLPFTVLLFRRGVENRRVTFCKVDEAHVSGSGQRRAHDRRFTGSDEIVRLLAEPDDKACISVNVDTIQEQDFTFIPDRYLVRASELLADASRIQVPLGNLVEIIKPQFLASDESPEGSEIQEAIPSEMPRYGYLERVKRTRRVDAKQLKARYRQLVEHGDVLLSTKGTIGTVAIAKPDASCGIPLLTSQASVILRLKSGVEVTDPHYLVMYLRSPAVQRALGALATGAAIQNIALDDLRALPVQVPSAADQMALAKAFQEQVVAQAQIDALTKKQRDLGDVAWQEMGLFDVAN